MLVVDDNSESRRIFCDALQELFPSLLVQGVGSLTEVLRICRECPLHLVFIDIQFSGGIGVDLADFILRKNPETVVVLCADTDIPHRFQVEARRLGISRILFKDRLDWIELRELARADQARRERRDPERRAYPTRSITGDRRAS